MKDTLLFVNDAGRVKRYHTVHTLHEDTVAAHAWGVAVLLAAIVQHDTAATPSAELLMAALHHDSAEYELGDTPSPTKRALGVHAQVNELEERILAHHSVGHYFEHLQPMELRWLKYADILDGMLFCLRERQFGNAGIATVYWRFHNYLTQMKPHEDSVGTAKLLQAVEQLWAAVSAGRGLHPVNHRSVLERLSTPAKVVEVVQHDDAEAERIAQEEIIQSRRLQAQNDQ